MEKEVMVIKEGNSFKKIEVMPLYTRLFGESEHANTYLAILGVHRASIPRFRDCLLINKNNELQILIYTRTGGTNRKQYDACNKDNLEGPWNLILREHPNYLKDEDCPQDATYANFYFKIPADALSFMKHKEPDTFPADKWKTFFECGGLGSLDVTDKKHDDLREVFNYINNNNNNNIKVTFKADNEVCSKFRNMKT